MKHQTGRCWVARRLGIRLAHSYPSAFLLSVTLVFVGLTGLQSLPARAENFCTKECAPYEGKAPSTSQCDACGPAADACRQQLTAFFTSVQPTCHAVTELNKAQDMQHKISVGYTAAAEICAASCATYIAASTAAAASVFGAGAIKAIKLSTDAICTGGGLVAAYKDYEENKKLEKDYRNFSAKMAILGMVAPWAQKQIATMAAKAGLGAIGSKVGGSCVSMLIYAGVAKSKNLGKDQFKESARSNCDSVKAQISASPNFQTYCTGGGSPTNTPTAPPVIQGNPATQVSQGGIGDGSLPTPGASASPVASQGEGFANQVMNAASAGELGPAFQEFQPDQLQGDLKQATGMDLKQLSDAMESGAGVGELISGFQGFPPDVQASLKQIDHDPELLQMFMSTDGSGLLGYAKGGSTRPVKKEPEMAGMGFGFKFGEKTETGGQPQEIGFKKEAPTLPADGDIFHSAWKGSIFQIVSTKIKGTRDRIQELEWSLPLNRALVGLPAKPQSPTRMPASGGQP